MKKLAIYFLVILLCYGCCSNNSNPVDSDESKIEPGTILPLAIGNWWDYKVAVNDSVYLTRVIITDKKNIDGVEWYVAFDTAANQTTLYSDREDGLYALTELFPKEQLLCKYMVQVGSVWEDTLYVASEVYNGLFNKVIRVYEYQSNIVHWESTLGEFRCYAIKVFHRAVDLEDRRFEEFYFYRNIGIIHFSYQTLPIIPSEMVITNFDLIDYHIE